MVGMENEYAIHRPGQDRIDPGTARQGTAKSMFRKFSA